MNSVTSRLESANIRSYRSNTTEYISDNQNYNFTKFNANSAFFNEDKINIQNLRAKTLVYSTRYDAQEPSNANFFSDTNSINYARSKSFENKNVYSSISINPQENNKYYDIQSPASNNVSNYKDYCEQIKVNPINSPASNNVSSYKDYCDTLQTSKKDLDRKLENAVKSLENRNKFVKNKCNTDTCATKKFEKNVEKEKKLREADKNIRHLVEENDVLFGHLNKYKIEVVNNNLQTMHNTKNNSMRNSYMNSQQKFLEKEHENVNEQQKNKLKIAIKELEKTLRSQNEEIKLFKKKASTKA